MKIQSFRAEVLDSTTHKYASSKVEGGGGYVASTSNGAVYGATKGVTTTVTHHVDQDIWLRDLGTGREFKLELKSSDFSARPGHIIRATYDEGTEAYERLYNEATHQLSWGNGAKLNEPSIEEWRKMLYGMNRSNKKPHIIMLILFGIPVLGSVFAFLVGVNYLLTTFEVGECKTNHKFMNKLIAVIALAGLTIPQYFIAASFKSQGIGIDNLGWMLSGIGVFALCFKNFYTLWSTPILELIDLIEKRSKLHEEVLRNIDPPYPRAIVR